MFGHNQVRHVTPWETSNDAPLVLVVAHTNTCTTFTGIDKIHIEEGLVTGYYEEEEQTMFPDDHNWFILSRDQLKWLSVADLIDEMEETHSNQEMAKKRLERFHDDG